MRKNRILPLLYEHLLHFLWEWICLLLHWCTKKTEREPKNDISKTTSMLSLCALLKPLFSPQTAFLMQLVYLL